jgi:hypothetical protein
MYYNYNKVDCRVNFNIDIFTGKRKLCWQRCTSKGASQKTKLSRTDKNNKKYNLTISCCIISENLHHRENMSGLYSREASDAGEFHLKTKSRDFRVIFDEK